MKILLVNPHHAESYYYFSHALRTSSGKSPELPLALLTVSSLLPSHWERKLADLNTGSLNDRDIKWADYVYLSAIPEQRESAMELIRRCRQMGGRIAAGGPLFTEDNAAFPDVDHLVLDEAEITVPLFAEDAEKGKPGRIYSSPGFADMAMSPLPDYSLIVPGNYSAAIIEYSRGCPYNCEFCNISSLSGHKVRTKSTYQVLSELGQLLETGWRGCVFFAGDNFIGNRRKLKSELLPALMIWMESNGHPFSFMTEASDSLAADEELMNMMAAAGFSRVLICSEKPGEAFLSKHKKANRGNRRLSSCLDLVRRGLFSPAEKVLTS